MQILAVTRRIAVLCGICSPSDGSGFREKFVQMSIIAFFLVNRVLLEWSNVMYALYQLETDNIVAALSGCQQLAGGMTTLFSYVTVVYQRQSTRYIFDGLQTVFDRCEFKEKFLFCRLVRSNHSPLNHIHFARTVKNTPSTRFYLETNELCEKLMKWSVILVQCSFLAPSLSLLVGGAIFYYIRDGYVRTENLYMPIRTR